MLFNFYPAYVLSSNENDEILFHLDIGFFRLKYIELIIIFWILMFLMEFLRQMFLSEAFERKLSIKIKNYFDLWNILEAIIYIVFFIGVGLRFYPTIKQNCFGYEESCMEIGRYIF